jgi:hypothetical protein
MHIPLRDGAESVISTEVIIKSAVDNHLGPTSEPVV